MSTIAIIYESRSGNTRALAEAVAAGISGTGLIPRVIPVEKAKIEDLVEADGIVIGSFTSYGTLGGKTKAFLDETAAVHGELAGKAGGAFATAGGLGGGVESTVLTILNALLVAGLVIPGDSASPHYGAVAIGKPDEAAVEAARRLGRRVADLARKLGVASGSLASLIRP